MSDVPPASPPRLTRTHWLIVGVAALGFAFDTYELLMMPIIARPALEELLGVNQYTDSGHALILKWTGYITYASAISGGIFGLLGGYLTDWFGRRRVLVWSILLYAFSALAAGFSTSPEMLLILRCTTFIGVCVEFVAAVAWLAELFPEPRQRELVLGYTQAFSSVGGLLVTLAFTIVVNSAEHLPSIHGHTGISLAWRYTLISGVIPALPLILIRPFLPESPAWQAKRAAGTLRRPSLGQLFQPAFRRTTLVTAAMFACSLGVAFGALQLTPQIVPGLVPGLPKIAQLRKDLEKAPPGSEEANKIMEAIQPLAKQQETTVGSVQLYQEIGGLLGRFFLAWLAIRILSRRRLLRVFLLPGLVIIPFVYLFPAAGKLQNYNLELLQVGIFAAGFFTIAQLSFWGNYLPRVYPVHLRGTGESFAANIGGRMIGTAANPLNTLLLAPLILQSVDVSRSASVAYAAAAISLFLYCLALVLSFLLPEPKDGLSD